MVNLTLEQYRTLHKVSRCFVIIRLNWSLENTHAEKFKLFSIVTHKLISKPHACAASSCKLFQVKS